MPEWLKLLLDGAVFVAKNAKKLVGKRPPPGPDVPRFGDKKP